MASVPLGFVSEFTSASVPQGKGLYCGPPPGSALSTLVVPATGTPYGGVADGAGLTIWSGGTVSTLTAQPQNVLRLTGAFGTQYIQGSNIAFSLPFSGNAGVRILPSTNQINVNNIVFVSTINALGPSGTGSSGAINMIQLTSTIKGYGWANVGPASP